MEADEKVCPFCAELIKVAAVKCKHCGEFFEPTTRGSTVLLGARGIPAGTSVSEPVGASGASGTDQGRTESQSQAVAGPPDARRLELRTSGAGAPSGSTAESAPADRSARQSNDSAIGNVDKYVAWGLFLVGVVLFLVSFSIADSAEYGPDATPGLGWAIGGGFFLFLPGMYLWVSRGTTEDFDRRAEVAARKDQARKDAKVVAAVNCPSCGSSRAERVTVGKRTTSAAMGGLMFSRKARSAPKHRSPGPVITEIIFHVRGDGVTLDDGTPITDTVTERIAPQSFLRAMIHDAETNPADASNRRRHPTPR